MTTPNKTLNTVAIVWTALVAIIPVIFGVVMLTNPSAVSPPSVGLTELFRAMSFRNFAYSTVLAAALLTQPRRVVAFLLIGRGLTEWADGCSGVFTVSAAASIAPFIGGLGDLVFGAYLSRQDPATKLLS